MDGNGVIKVSDFGLMEDMYCTNYFRQKPTEMGNEEKVPIKWMAPECIETNTYDESTDVVRFKDFAAFGLYHFCDIFTI